MLALLGLFLLSASPAAATTIGSSLIASPNAGICKTESGGSEASCTYAQFMLAEGHVAGGGRFAREPGVITRWQLASGVPTPATASVKMRLRTIQLTSEGSRVGGFSPYVELPLDRPGLHSFPTRFPIGPFEQPAIDLFVTGRGDGEAAAPLAHEESGVGDLFKWTPPLNEGPFPFPPFPPREDALELLLNAVVEPDRDRDGFGDRTQDRCPEDRTRQANCDRRPPRTRLTYAPRQDFLDSGKVIVFLRSNEDARAIADGQIEIPGRITHIWGIHPARRQLERGEKERLVLRMPAKARNAVARAFANGKPVIAKVFASATDRAGNESGTTVATIRPKR